MNRLTVNSFRALTYWPWQIDLQLRHLIRYPGLLDHIARVFWIPLTNAGGDHRIPRLVMHPASSHAQLDDLLVACWIAGHRSLGVGESVQAVQKAGRPTTGCSRAEITLGALHWVCLGTPVRIGLERAAGPRASHCWGISHSTKLVKELIWVGVPVIAVTALVLVLFR